MKEDIRQKIIFSEYKALYTLYMTEFENKCLEIFQDKKFVEDCSRTLMDSLKIDGKKVQNKVD